MIYMLCFVSQLQVQNQLPAAAVRQAPPTPLRLQEVIQVLQILITLQHLRPVQPKVEDVPLTPTLVNPMLKRNQLKMHKVVHQTQMHHLERRRRMLKLMVLVLQQNLKVP